MIFFTSEVNDVTNSLDFVYCANMQIHIFIHLTKLINELLSMVFLSHVIYDSQRGGKKQKPNDSPIESQRYKKNRKEL